MSDERIMIREFHAVLEQGLLAIENLDAEVYARSPEPLATSGVGPHFRHCLDSFECFLDGLSEGVIDYDRRERDERVEVDPRWAVERIRNLQSRIEALGDIDGKVALRVRMDAPADVAPDEGWRLSTVGRELAYLASHAIHHYALIAMILRHFGQDPGPEFGVAPSTLNYWRETGRCAPLLG